MALLQRQLEGKYEILEKIKEGGMGAVYKVRHRFLDEIRVIKVIRSSLESSQELSDRFLREARLAIRLRHPSIAILHDFAVDDDGKAFIVMEHIAGLTLEDVLRTGGPPPLGLSLEIASQALRAMGYLHRHGFVHRDIAPDNLMLTRGVDGEPLVKLIDLGIAKVLAGEGAATTTGIFLGKPRYASPEQFSAQEIDHRSDLYSFGVVFYELLTRQCPVAGNDPASYMAGHLFRPPLDFAESDPRGAIPADLRRVVLRALAKTPGERFASATEFARALAPLQDRFPVQAGDLEDALQPSLDKTALWSAPAPAGSSQVLLDRQFLAGTTPPPAAHGSHLQWDPRLVAPETLPPVAPVTSGEARGERQAEPPPTISEARDGRPAAAAPVDSRGTLRSSEPPPPASGTLPVPAPPPPPQPDPSLDETVPLTARVRKPATSPPLPPRTVAPLAARTLAGVPPAKPPGQEAGELPLPAARSAPAAPTSKDWEARPLQRAGSPGGVQATGGGGPTLGFGRAGAAPPDTAAPAARSPAVRTGARSIPAWVAGALLLVAGALGGTWWYLHPQTAAGRAASSRAGTAPQRGAGAPGTMDAAAAARPTGTARPAGVVGPTGSLGSAGPMGSPLPVGAAGPVSTAGPPSAVAATPPAMPAPHTPALRPPAAKVAAGPPAGRAAASAGPSGRAGASPARGADRAAAPTPAPEPPGPGAEAAEPVDVPDAIYPAAARGTGKEPKVLLAVLVDEHGAVAEVRVKEGDSSHLGFNEAAVAAARKARFLAATRNGVPVRSWSELIIDFVSPQHP